MHTFRLLHLSDLHLASQPNEINFLNGMLEGIAPDAHWTLWATSYDPNKVDQVARFAYQFRKKIDAILITGDLATTGWNPDLQKALKFVDARPVNARAWFSEDDIGGVFPTLQGANVTVWLLPGNHDRFHRNPPYFPGSKAFDMAFEDYWTAQQGVQVHRPILESADGSESLAIVSADCTLRSASHAGIPGVGLLGQGRVYDDIVRSLIRETECVRENSETAVIWALHFAPEPPVSNPLHMLISESQLLRAAQSPSVKVKHILCGHLHRAAEYKTVVGGRVQVRIAGTACQCGNNEWVPCIYEIDVEGGSIVGDIRALACRYDPDQGWFNCP